MSEYKAIKGFKVQTVSTDPAASVIATGTWASGGTMNNPYAAGGGDGGTSGAAFAAGGASSSYNTTHEQYNGSAWTTATGMNTARGFGGAGGTTTAAFVATGRINPTSVTTNTELWNGSAWTEVNNVNSGRFSVGSGIGTQTAGLIGAGTTVPVLVDATESWDGTNWTELGAYPGTASEGINLFGTYTAAIFAGGYTGSVPRGGSGTWVSPAFIWNGSAYTAITALPTTRANGGSVGTTTNGLIAGGYNGTATITSTLSYNGSTWTELNDLSTSAQGWGSSKGGTTSDTIVFGGANTNTEEWTTTPAPTFQQENLGQVFYNSTSNAFKVTKTVTGTGAWASGGNLNEAKNAVAGAGIQTAALAAGGYTATAATSNTELYNGTSWTEVNNLNTARYYLGGAGSQTAAIATAGKTDPNVAKSENESWNGTSWTEVNDVNTARWQFGQAGTATASLMASGTTDNTTTTNSTESWNGTSWTEITEVNVARFAAVMTGSQTEALYIAGEKGTPDSGGGAPYIKIGNTEYWNGSTWTELADLNTARNQIGGSGIYTSSLIFAGPPTPTNTESWDGTSWTEVNNLAVGGEFRTGAGGNASTPNTTALAIGASPPLSAATEEWTVPSSTQNQTLTAS